MRRSNCVRKKAVSSACTVCKKRKLKCDGNKPCGRCVKLKAPTECIYDVDKRKDKRAAQNGSRVFIFKSQNICTGDDCFGSSSRKLNEKLYSHVSEVGSSKFDPVVYIPRVEANDIVTVNDDKWNYPLSMDFDFNDFNTNAIDFDEFSKLVGDDLSSIENNNPSYSLIEAEFNGVVKETEGEDDALPRSRLIDVLFENEFHALPGIPKWRLLELENRYGKNLECTQGNSDERFLLSTALCLGSLTIRKKELLNHSNIENHGLLLENDLSKLTADAFKYYNVAKTLVSDLLLHPTIDGFCGLVLMANFITIMISLEGQLSLSKNALQLAVILNLNDGKICKELLESKGYGIDVILLFWNLWCSSCMLATIHGRSPFITLQNITTPLPYELYSGNEKSALSVDFMQLRIKLAELQGTVFQQLYTSNTINTINELQFINLEREFEQVSIQVTRLQGSPIFEEHLFYRSRVLMLELSCLRAQTSFLLYRPYLISGKSVQAVTMAKSIIHEIWSYYTKKFPNNEKERRKHLDWNFCYPIRTASLTLCVSCIILLKYKQVMRFHEDIEQFEYALALEILHDLVQILPIEQKLLDLVKAPINSQWPSDDSFVNFWALMLNGKTPLALSF